MTEGFRTLDPRSHNPVLYQLSYSHHTLQLLLAEVRQKGFEPLTYGLEGRCSIHLSYWREPEMVQAIGARGFEPPTPCTQGRCATRLRYAPSRSCTSRAVSHRRLRRSMGAP